MATVTRRIAEDVMANRNGIWLSHGLAAISAPTRGVLKPALSSCPDAPHCHRVVDERSIAASPVRVGAGTGRCPVLATERRATALAQPGSPGTKRAGSWVDADLRSGSACHPP